MKNKQSNLAERRKGVFLLCLPVLILPLIFLLGMSGGEARVPEEIQKGLNQEMPKVLIKEKNTSKAEAYSLEKKLKEEPMDLEMPTFLQQSLAESGNKEIKEKGESKESLVGHGFSSTRSNTGFSSAASGKPKELPDPEKEMMDQLKELEKLLNSEPENPAIKKPAVGSFSKELSGELFQEKAEWEKLMGELEGGSVADPELEQLEGLLDKLVLLQQGMNQPEESKEFTERNGVKPVPISTKSTKESSSGGWERMADIPVEDVVINGFYGLEEEGIEQGVSKSFQSTLKAHVAESQEILPGEAVELILDQELILGEIQIPAGTLLYASSSLSGARLQLSVSGLVWEDQLIPVDLKAYGLDGLPGVEIADQKGASQWLDQSAQGAQGMRLNTLGMDWKSQLATSGVEASRSLIRTKSRVKKLRIKAGHPLLLIDFSNTSSL